MSHVGAPRGRTCSRTLRSLALLTTGVLALPVLSACTSDDDGASADAAPDIAAAGRDHVTAGGSLRWAIDTMPSTLNAFQADADGSTSRIAAAVLPSLFTLDKRGRPQRNPDYLESAKIVEREPKQVVLYKLNQQAVWSDGREIGAPDFVAQWRALSGKNSAYWTARNAGYERIEKIERGANDLEVRVTFSKPYADWRALFTPLYPKDVTGTPNSFNDGARSSLKTTAGPFSVKKVDRKGKEVTLVRSARWWGEPAKLDSLVLRAVPRSKRASALADGKLDLAEIDKSAADRIALAVRDRGSGEQKLTHGPGVAITPASALRSWALANGSDEEKAEAAQIAREQTAAAIVRYAKEQKTLHGFVVRKSLEPAYTQLALNGEQGPLADERVRRAVARALDRQELADTVLKPLGLPARPLGSHLALVGQEAYADSSAALGKQDTQEARALLADAGWVPGGALKKDGAKAGSKAEKPEPDEDEEEENEEEAEEKPKEKSAAEKKYDAKQRELAKKEEEEAKKNEKADDKPDVPSSEGTVIVGDEKPGKRKPGQDQQPAQPKPGLGLRPDEEDRTAQEHLGGREHRSAQEHQPGEIDPAIQDDKPIQDGKPGQTGPRPESATHVLAPAPAAAFHGVTLLRQAAAVRDPRSARSARHAHYASHARYVQDEDKKPGAYAPRGTAAAPTPSVSGSPTPMTGPLGKDGKALTLRFVLPSGEGSEALRTVGERIARMLNRIGIKTEITKVPDEGYFKDHVASGDYDLALYSWPATAYPATDGRPIFAKPVPASDGSLLVEQNYTRVGTDHIDQLFNRAVAEIDEKASRSLVKQADARIWAAAGSIPLFQRPELVAAKPEVVNAGAFGLAAPRYQDIGFTNAGTSGSGGKEEKKK
ncbi:ABC transporter substrate-binding protein [Streptomyces sp. NPDC059743]|uniref:ABC transporter substrate-binding protein n=1 Tax=Streptomyces sp. NPDC059743 TaxID=3346928 RepID=UPI003654FCEB